MKREYNSVKDLYNHVLPALRCKKHEIQINNHKIVDEESIWSYLKDNIWSKETNLTLADLVDDILNTENDLIINYKKEREETR